MRKIETLEENRKWVPSVWRNENMKSEWEKEICGVLGFEQRNKEGWSFEECGEWDHEDVTAKLG